MDERDRVRLRVRGYDHEGWTSVRVNRSIENACATFEFDVALADDGTVERNAAALAAARAIAGAEVYAGDTCEVRIGSTVVVTGVIDVADIAVSADDAEVSLDGRSKTRELVDCSAELETGELLGMTAAQIAVMLATPHGVAVVVNDSTGTLLPLPRFVAEGGEKVYELLERVAREQALVLTDDRFGRIVLTRAGALPAPGAALTLPGNVIRIRHRADASQRFNRYLVEAQRPGDDANSGASAAEVSGGAVDDGAPTNRVLVLPAEDATDDAGAMRRAEWEAATRIARSTTVEVEVDGWRDPAGNLWQPNTLVPVTAPAARVGRIGAPAILLVVSCAYSLDDSGMSTTMRLAPPDAYALLAPNAAARAAAGKTGAATKGLGLWIEGRV